MADEPKKARNPAWTRDELILALEYYLDNPQGSHDGSEDGVKRLSKEINEVGRLLGHTTSDTFRNANGVSMKLMNFRNHDPYYINSGRIGLSRGNKLEGKLWDEFAGDRARLKTAAVAIRRWAMSDEQSEERTAIGEDEPEVADAAEGKLVTRVHRARERNRNLVKRKKESFQKKHGRLFCEVCNFDFAAVYGSRGEGFIECHHLKPVSSLEPGEKTALRDLAMLCANCHRMVHAKTPWLSLRELRSLLRRA